MQKVTQDLKKFGTTLGLAAAGTVAAGPIGLVIGGAVGGAIDYWRAKRVKTPMRIAIPEETGPVTPPEIQAAARRAAVRNISTVTRPAALAASLPAVSSPVAGESTSIKG